MNPVQGINFPGNYVSPDVIDRRNGQSSTVGDWLRDLMIKVRDDYQSSIGSNPNAMPIPGLDQTPMGAMVRGALSKK